jgi:hypothetical protein
LSYTVSSTARRCMEVPVASARSSASPKRQSNGAAQRRLRPRRVELASLRSQREDRSFSIHSPARRRSIQGSA